MATDKRRVAAYLPDEVDEAFKAYKIKHGFATENEPHKDDSKALIHILREFLEVEHSVAHSVTLPDNLVTTEQLQQVKDNFGVRIGELLSELQKLAHRFDTFSAGTNLELQPDVVAEVPGQLNMLDRQAANDQLPEGGFEIPKEWLQGLSATKLADILGVDRKAIGKRKSLDTFGDWSASKGRGIPWEYRKDTRKFYPVCDTFAIGT